MADASVLVGEAGVDADGLREALTLAAGCVEQGLDAGLALFAARRGQVVLDAVVGTDTRGDPLTCETRFLLLSACKPLTAAAVAVLAGRGVLSFDDPLVRHIPEFGAGVRADVTLDHLLTHRAGIPDAELTRVTAQDWCDWDTAVAKTCALPLEQPPGTVATYHPLSFGLLGEVVARAAGRRFADVFADEVSGPLGMRSFSWGRPAGAAFTALGLPGQPQTEAARLFQTPAADAAVIPAGNGWGTARDLGRFYRAMGAGGGTWLGEEQARRMTQVHVLPPGEAGRGYGFEVGTVPGRAGVFGSLAGPRTFGHAGGRSCVAWCDPDSGLVGVVLGNGAPDPIEGERRLSLLSDALHQAVST